MPRSFVIISKAAAVMANLSDCLFEIDELAGTGCRAVCRSFPCARRSRSNFSKDRIKRILREHVLDIGDQQFLMLLLVMNAKDDQRFDLIEQLFVRARKKRV